MTPERRKALARESLGKLVMSAAGKVERLSKAKDEKKLEQALETLESLLWAMARSVGKSNVAYLDAERIAARAAGDRTRELASLRRKCLVYRQGIRSLASHSVDLSNDGTLNVLLVRLRQTIKTVKNLDAAAGADEQRVSLRLYAQLGLS